MAALYAWFLLASKGWCMVCGQPPLWCIHFEATPLPFSLPSSLYSPQIFLQFFHFFARLLSMPVFKNTHHNPIGYFDGVCLTIKFHPPAIYLNIFYPRHGMVWEDMAASFPNTKWSRDQYILPFCCDIWKQQRSRSIPTMASLLAPTQFDVI